jgi:hypothetical protein
MNVLEDDSFLTPNEYGAPSCPICDSQLWVEIDERDEDGLPKRVLVFCQKNETGPYQERHRDWDYTDLLTAIGEVITWCEEERERKRRWEIALWGESRIQAMVD